MKKILFSSAVLLFTTFGVYAQSQGLGGSGSLNANAQWKTNGNSAQSTDFIGTTNSTDLIFRTNNTVRGRVDAGGDLIWDGGGRVLINVPNPVANLMFQLNGDGIIGGELTGNRGKFVKLLIQDLRPDTIHMDTNKVIHGHTRVLGDVKINGTLTGIDATFSGNLTSSNLRVTSLSGSGDRDLVVDANGNLKTTLPGGFGCTANSLNWTLGGNQIGPWMQYGQPAAGTCDNFDFILQANSTPYVWLKPDGKLGLGTNSPGAMFDIKTSGTINGFNILNGNNSLFLVKSDGSTGINNGTPYKMLTVNGDVSFANYTSTGVNAGIDGLNGMEILGANKVPTRRGIATDDDPNGDVNFYVNGYQTSSSPGGVPTFNFKNGIEKSTNQQATTGANAPNLMSLNAKGCVNIFNNDGVSSPLLIQNTTLINKNILEVSSNGTMTLSTSSGQTDNAFDISDKNNNDKVNFRVKTNGQVYAREVIVSLNLFPDYVFARDYKLMPLSVVKKYTETQYHLPNMPTAKEVEKNGANLGEIQRVSVEKLEEIYLYMFEMSEEIKASKEEIKALKEKIMKLESK